LDASDDAEDTDLFPRTFTINAVGSKNNHWAYAEINPISDLRFTALAPPLQGQTPVYDDINKGIDGRDINAPAEPVRLYTALGGRFCNLGVSGSDGIQRVSAGPNPGVDYQPITLAGFLLPNRSFRLGLLGTPNTKYTIQASEDLKSWVPLMSGLAPIDTWTLKPPENLNVSIAQSPTNNRNPLMQLTSILNRCRKITLPTAKGQLHHLLLPALLGVSPMAAPLLCARTPSIRASPSLTPPLSKMCGTTRPTTRSQQ